MERTAPGVLSPTLVTAIDDLELAARVVVEGLRVGGHRSPFQGAGAEFHQHRPYRAGDDLKHLDWKLYGRSDRLYTRRFRESTNVGLMLVIDTSASMDFPQQAAESKLRYAIMLAAALAYLAVEQGNAVGFMSLAPQYASGAPRLHYLPARSGRVHLRTLLTQLDALEPGGMWDPPLAIGRAAELLQRRGLVMVLSDFYDQEAATQRELRQVVQHGHDVAVLQMVAAAERDLPYGEQIEVQDAEQAARMLIDPAALRRTYVAEHEAFLTRWREFAWQEGVDYARFDCDVPPERALREYLVRRVTGREAAQTAALPTASPAANTLEPS